MTLENCYFCGVTDETVLVDHHVIPKQIDPEGEHDDLIATVCRNCHKKIHDVADPIIENKIHKEKPEPSESKDTAFDPYDYVIDNLPRDYMEPDPEQVIRNSELDLDTGEPVSDVVGVLEDSGLDTPPQSFIEEKRQMGEYYKPDSKTLRRA